MPGVIIYRNELLPISETFILSQARKLKMFEPHFVGLRAQPTSLELPTNPVLLSSGIGMTAKARGAFYKVSGIAPIFHRRVASLGADLVHAHFSVDGVNALALAAALETPLIVTIHGIDVTKTDDVYRQSLSGRLYLKGRRQLWKRTAVFTCDSEFLRRKALALGFPEDKLIVHYVGVDLNLFKRATAVPVQNTVVFVGRLVEKKGCNYLIEAMREVQARVPDAQLILVGDGPDRLGLEQQAKRLSVRCDFRGAQPTEVIRGLLASARVFCAPSVTAKNGDSEGLGIVFAEAQAMGVPVVSFAHGGIPEVVRHGITGLLAPEGDSRTLAQYILRYFTDSSFWRACSEAGRTWITERFNLEQQTARLEEIYRRVASR